MEYRLRRAQKFSTLSRSLASESPHTDVIFIAHVEIRLAQLPTAINPI